MSKIDRIIKELSSTIRTANDRATTAYDTTGTVTRIEGNTAWVHLLGGISETPVRMTIDSKAGDKVQVRVGGGMAWITGNDTAPPTDDQEAIIAQVSARLADKKAVTAGKTANQAREEIKAVAQDLIVTNQLVAEKATIVDLDAEKARINQLVANSLTADSAVIKDLEADTAKIHSLTAEQLASATAYIAQLIAGSIQASTIIADNGRINNLETNALTAQSAEIQNLQADTAKIHSLTADQLSSAVAYIATLIAQNIRATDLTADHATVGSLDSNYARINLANVNNAWIENGVVKDASIADAKIIGVSANKLTAGTIDASQITVTNLNADNITAGTINGQRIGNASIDLNKLSQEVPTKAYLDAQIGAIEDRIDGAIETFTGNVIPTLNNYPASSWTDATTRHSHVGDVYYVVNSGDSAEGHSYRFAEDATTGTYEWVQISDSDVTRALQELIDVKGDISDLQTFESQTNTWKTQKDTEISSLQSSTTSLTTALGTKVDTSTFNTLSQAVDTNTASITNLSTVVNTKADGSTVTTLSNTVNQVQQTANANTASISSLTEVVEENQTTITNKYNNLTQDLNGFKSEVGEFMSQTSGFNVHSDYGDSDLVTLHASVTRAGKEIRSEFPEVWFSWHKKSDTDYVTIGTGYDIQVSKEDYDYNDSIVGRFTICEEDYLMFPDGSPVIMPDNEQMMVYYQ